MWPEQLQAFAVRREAVGLVADLEILHIVVELQQRVVVAQLAWAGVFEPLGFETEAVAEVAPVFVLLTAEFELMAGQLE